MSKHYIHTLIAQGENQHLDFKYVISDAPKIARTLSAFANTDGGKLLIGVKDNGVITGVRTDEEAYMIESAAQLYCKPEVLYTLNSWIVEGKQVLEITVTPSNQKPHLAPWKDGQWRAYVRVHDENFVAGSIQVAVWKKIRSGTPTLVRYSEAENQILDFLHQYPGSSFNDIRKHCPTGYHRIKRILVNLVTIGVIQIHHSENTIRYLLHENPAG